MITVLTGNNNFALRSELDLSVADFVKKYGSMAVEKLDGDEVEYEKITEAIQSLPFLVDKKLVVLNRPGTQKRFAENIETLIESVSDSTDVLIVEPKLDKRSVYYKTLRAKTEFKQFDELGPRDLPKWLVGQAEAAGGKLAFGDAVYLVDRVGTNQLLLANELKKLLIYAPNITRQTIDMLTEPAPQGTVFQLLDAAFAGNQARAQQLYKQQRAQRVEPLAILAMLAWQLHVLAIVKAAGDRQPAEIAKQAGLSPFAVQKSARLTKAMPMTEIKRLTKDLSRIDLRIKSAAVDPDEALQNYLLSISS